MWQITNLDLGVDGTNESNRIVLSWTRPGGHQVSPTWQTIVEHLDRVKVGDGVVGLEEVNSRGFVLKSLQLRAESGQYLLTLGEFTDDDDWDVRSFNNGQPQGPQIEILGDFWDNRMICINFRIVVQVFDEWFQTGSVNSQMFD